MSKVTFYIIIYGLVAAAANLVGGMLVSVRRLGQTTLRYLIALGAGFMLAAVFLKIIPEAVELWSGRVGPPMAWFLGGYLLIQLFEHTVAPHFHFGEETHEQAMLAHHAAMAGIGALMIHTFFDGVSIAVGFLVNFQLGILIFIAILLHKLPEGFTVASMMLAAGGGRRRASIAAFMIGLATFSGAAVVVLFQQVAVHSLPISSYALPLSAGVTLYVAASDLIPEVNSHEVRGKAALLVFAGVAGYYLVDLILQKLV
jgi:zinc transporter ZupT